MMRKRYVLLLGFLLAAGAPLEAQEDGALRLFVSGGMQTSPDSYDSFRPVEYDSGLQFGGGIALVLSETFAVRGEMAKGSNSGFEAGVLNEDVEMDRSYYGVSAELTLPVAMAVSPYALIGAGMVHIDRDGPSYTFAVTEVTGQVGAGLRVPVGLAATSAFVQGTTWVYANSSTDEWQVDPVLSLGLAYTVPF